MAVSMVLFTSDLRVHDHPPLRAALRATDAVVPLFVLDTGIDATGFAVPNRRAFLADCLTDLDAALRRRGGRLVVRQGEVVAEVCRVAAEAGAGEVHVSAGVTAYARRREERLRRALESAGRRLVVHDAVTTVVPPGVLTPAASDHFAVFTPYFRHWSQHRPRDVLGAPRVVRVPDGVGSADLPARRDVAGVSEGLAAGGETAGRRRMAAWLRDGIARYAGTHDDLGADATSRLSAHLHFGTVSPTELVRRARAADGAGAGAEAFVRQLAWRDFHHQVLAARPHAATADYRTRHDRWRTGPRAEADIEAWREGRTGYPLVDAAMRQLRHEGWMHNRARMVAASFLAKTLYVDWRTGARHFLDLLVDGDVADNQLNWQWVAGTGTDTRPNRVLNPLAQARRYDPDGTYVRRWLPGSAGADGGGPRPVVGLAEALDRFRQARGPARPAV
ncbi:deoxyribodipyrimidine photo-lyase [Streptomyces mashuensis]|uniref:Deoxyribodipyrimidine photo-lyase n=1 Tax=Streptomyces mashuensis TaxID=33904 RepID=A0A919EFR6_9ACTN|nr:deoxyribodipyrimidine photo-lyase [Streptomyces mashuensis]GHF67218.1 deoxyribodipyrimidine photo-lyase [Streptomyces mashuensis]